MATTSERSLSPEPSDPLPEARRLFHRAEELETDPDRSRYTEALKGFLAYVETHQAALEPAAGELAGHLDGAAMAFYRASLPELASRAADVGLHFAPGSASLLHHKALILLAQNQRVDLALSLVEKALEASPHDKGIWATKGDALRLLQRPGEAAEAYLHAQQLDASSTQYVDRALRLAPKNATALRMKLQLAKAHGGDKQALEACEALLATAPGDVELLLAKAELLSNLGRFAEALASLEAIRAEKREEPRPMYLHARLTHALGHTDEALAEFRSLLALKKPLDASRLAEMARLVEEDGRDPSLAIEARERLHALEPRNLANLQSLRALAQSAERPEVAIAATQGILEASPANLDALRTLAELKLAQGAPDEAFDIYRQIVQAHPKETGEFRKAMLAAKTLGRLELVREFAGALLAAEPQDVGAQEELARAATELGEADRALALYGALLKQKPTEVAYLLEKRRLLAELDRVHDLPAVYDELFRLDPTRHDIALERGNLYLQAAFDAAEGSPERAQAATAALVSYERASLGPELRPPSLLGVARAARLVNDHERAIQAYRAFLATGGEGERAHVLKELGHALRETNRLSDAQEAYESAVKLGLEDLDLFWGLVEVLSLLNHDARALRYVDLILQRDPKNPLFLRRKGQILVKMGRRNEGLEVLKHAVEGSEGEPHARFEVAEALRAQGAYPDAIRYFEEGLALDAKSRPGRLALAETLILAGRYNEAIPHIDRLLHEDPNDLRAWVARADAYRALRRTPEVLYSLKAVLLLDPHNPSALTEKARLHLAAGEKGEAYECLAQLLAGNVPEAHEAAAWLSLGDLATELGRPEEANRAFERASQIDPTRLGDVAARRARLRLNAGRPDLALEVLDQAAPALGQLPPERQSRARLLRAEILVALERQGEAQSVYEEVRRQDPRSQEAIAGVARCLLDQGKHPDAKAFLAEAIPKAAANAELFLLLAEAESGLGDLAGAVAAVKHGVEALPKAVSLWTRLGELEIRREQWTEAANAFGHAIALDASNVDLQLRAGFIAGKLGHPHEALALYDRATQVAPANKYAWSSRGLALLELGRPEEAHQSFERTLALDSDFEPAKEGKKAALQRTRETLIEKFGREGLLLEAKLHRPVTKNDLFVTLHVPYDLLDPILSALSRPPRVDLDRLPESEMRDLEGASYHLITAALERRPEGIERRGFTLADVAVLAPPNYSLQQTQRLFGYLKAVLETDIRPENLRLTPDVEELARRALLLPEHERTLFQLVRTLRVGLFKAKLIKAVETAGTAVHSPLPTLDLAQYSPEFSPEETTARAAAAAPAHPAGGAALAQPAPAAATVHARGHALPAGSPHPRCVGCGGIASIVHQCGAPICQHCISEFRTCPKCGEVVSATNSTRLQSVPAPREPAVASAAAAPARAASAHPKSVVRPVATPPARHPPPDRPAEEPRARPAVREVAHPKDAGEEEAAPPEEKPAPRPARPREPRDDEPRL